MRELLTARCTVPQGADYCYLEIFNSSGRTVDHCRPQIDPLDLRCPESVLNRTLSQGRYVSVDRDSEFVWTEQATRDGSTQ